MRTCFLLKVRPDKVEEYKAHHAAVWQEMQNALRKSGWRNYSIFLRPDGLVVGYLESDDFENACAQMKQHAINATWQERMAPFFESLDGKNADDNLTPIEEVFHLD